MKYNSIKADTINKDLTSFKKTISNSILFPLFLSIIISSILFSGIYLRDNAKEKASAEQNLLSTNKIFQAELSEKLAIFASSNIFFDFITSGEVTRKEILPYFLDQLTALKTSSINGFKIWYDAFGVKKNVYNYGKLSKHYATLKLCYAGTYLDNKYGSCYYYMRIFFSKNSVINDLKKLNNNIYVCKDCRPINLLNTSKLGDFLISNKSDLFVTLKVKEQHDYIFYYYLILTLILLFFALFNRNRIYRLINNVISKPLEDLVNKIKNNTLPEPDEEALSEINYLVKQIGLWNGQLEKVNEIEKEAAIGKLVTQVVHDIRSPLSALEMAIHSASSLPEEIRILIRKAVWRIHDIANGLLQINKQQVDQNTIVTSQLITTLISMIVREKQTQFSSVSFLEIESHLNISSYGLFAKIQASEFSRLLSNLINNAIEALDKIGKVIVSLENSGENIKITIIDNGKGIPTEILKKLGQRGLSYNKQNGSGLGLHHAKMCLESWGGNLSLYSTLNIGTTVTLTLPKAEAPPWFLPCISLVNEQYLVVIDDDDSIHEIWKNRIREFQQNNLFSIILIHLYSPQDLKLWKENKNNCLPITYLCDYEFIGYSETGCDLIINENIAKNSILVTSRCDDQNIIDECVKEKISILPKELASVVPFVTPPKKLLLDAILIDDSSLIRDAWSLSSKLNNKLLKTFNSYNEFIIESKNFSFETPIYIDSNLGNDIKGEEIAKDIYESGFKSIYLTSGYDPIEFPDLFHLKGILSKSPPWEKTIF